MVETHPRADKLVFSGSALFPGASATVGFVTHHANREPPVPEFRAGLLEVSRGPCPDVDWDHVAGRGVSALVSASVGLVVIRVNDEAQTRAECVSWRRQSGRDGNGYHCHIEGTTHGIAAHKVHGVFVAQGVDRLTTASIFFDSDKARFLCGMLRAMVDRPRTLNRRPDPCRLRWMMLAVCGGLVSWSAAVSAQTVSFPDSAEAIEARLTQDVTYLSSDELEGRGIRTRGLDLAAEFIAAEFAHAGANTTAYDGKPFHEFRLYSANPTGSVQSLSLRRGDQTPEALVYGEDYTSLMVSPAARIDAPVVFVGYGITDEKKGYDDYAGVNVQGKVVLVLRNEPQGERADRVFNGSELTDHAYLLRKIANAHQHGAIAMVLCTDARGLKVGEDGVTNSAHADPLLTVELTSGLGTETLPVVHCRRAMVERWVESATGQRLRDLETTIEERVVPQSQPLPGVVLNAKVSLTRPGKTLRNVVATVDGVGPLAKEALVIGAHYDHLGRGGWGSLAVGATDEIHNGADDNASGTAVMIEAARLLGAQPKTPRRRIIFIAFSGEELGLYGSKRYVEDPLVPLDQTVAMINLDMVGRLRNNQLTAYGTGTATEWPTWLEAAAGPRQLAIISRPSGFGPSDHASFHEHNVPVLHFFTGFHREYHRPGDDADKLNIPGMRQITQLVVDLATRIATTLERPRPTTAEQSLRLSLADSFEGVLQEEIIDRPLRLGIALETIDSGLRIEQLDRSGLAALSGLRIGDVLKAWNQQPLRSMREIKDALARTKAGTTAVLNFERGGIARDLEIRF